MCNRAILAREARERRHRWRRRSAPGSSLPTTRRAPAAGWRRSSGRRLRRRRSPRTGLQALARCRRRRPTSWSPTCGCPGIDGIELLRERARRVPDLIVVLMTAFADVETAVRAMQRGRGALPDQAAPDSTSCVLVIDRALERRAARRGDASSARGSRSAPLRQHHRHEPGDAGGLRRHRAGRAEQRERPHHRRERHRQGARRRGDPREQPARGGALRQAQLRRARRDAPRERALRPREGRVHRRGRRGARGASSRPTAARSSSTRSARSRPPSRSSSCASSRSGRSSASAATRRSRSTCASSPRPTATSPTEVARGQVPRGPLLPAQRRHHRAAAAARAAERHPAARDALPRAVRRGERQAHRRASPTTRSSASPATAGRATCASSRT